MRVARELRKLHQRNHGGDQENNSGSQWHENADISQFQEYEDDYRRNNNGDNRYFKTVRRIVLGFVVLCVLSFFGYIAVIHYNHPFSKTQRQVKQWDTFKTKQGLPPTEATQKPSEPDKADNTAGIFKTSNCMFNETGNLLVMGENGYEPFIYDAFPNIPANIFQIVQLLDDGENYLKLDYNDQKLFLYYALGDNKSRIVGGNVDIFNFSIDREKDIVAFSIEYLIFYEYLEDDYQPHLLETFNLLFGENGQEIFDYLMIFYGKRLEVKHKMKP